MKTMYYIAVLPPETIREEIKTFKTEVLRRFDSGHALRSPAHITLQMPFHYEEDEEAQLINALELLVRDEDKFSCELEGFGHFGNRTVFVEVHPNKELTSLRQRLQALLRKKFGFNSRKLPERFHPHITIANRDLAPEKFNSCRETFEGKTYRRTFGITTLALLKHKGDHWEVYREFPFREA